MTPTRHPFKGEMLTQGEIAQRTGLDPSTICRRLRAGVPLDLPDKRTLTAAERTEAGIGRRFTTAHYPKRITYRHTTGSISDWSLLTGLPSKLIRNRLLHGWDVGRALTARVGA